MISYRFVMVPRTVHQQRSEMEGKMRKAATRRKVSEHDNQYSRKWFLGLWVVWFGSNTNS